MPNAAPPATLDGARVLATTAAGARFGVAMRGDGTERPITALAVAQYDDAAGTYLFACDEAWQVVGDPFYDSVDDAKLDAERYYDTGPLVWHEITPTA